MGFEYLTKSHDSNKVTNKIRNTNKKNIEYGRNERNRHSTKEC